MQIPRHPDDNIIVNIYSCPYCGNLRVRDRCLECERNEKTMQLLNKYIKTEPVIKIQKAYLEITFQYDERINPDDLLKIIGDDMLVDHDGIKVINVTLVPDPRVINDNEEVK